MLAHGGLSELVERPLYDLVPVCICGCQVIEMGVKIVSQVRALGENAGFYVVWGRVGCRDDAVDKLGGSCRAKRILPLH